MHPRVSGSAWEGPDQRPDLARLVALRLFASVGGVDASGLHACMDACMHACNGTSVSQPGGLGGGLGSLNCSIACAFATPTGSSKQTRGTSSCTITGVLGRMPVLMFAAPTTSLCKQHK